MEIEMKQKLINFAWFIAAQASVVLVVVGVVYVG
jgi:hypothetical protein